MYHEISESMLANLAEWGAELKAQGRQRPLDRTDGRVVALRKPTRRSFREVISDIFERLEIVPGGCWEWQASRTWQGYGNVVFHMFEVRAHMAMWRIFNGHYDPKLKVCHSCNNPPCGNPNHLYLATQLQNVRDAIRDGLKPPGPCGEYHYRAKLTANKVIEYRNRHAAGETIKSMQIESGIYSVIYAVQGKSWKHLPMPPALAQRYQSKL